MLKTLQTNVKVHNFNAKVRKFSSAREAAFLKTLYQKVFMIAW